MKAFARFACFAAMLMAAALLIGHASWAQPQTDSSILKLDPGLDNIVPESAKVEKAAGGFAFTEGPVWSHNGYLLFSDIPNNVVNKLASDGKVSVFVRKSGYSGNDALPLPKPFNLEVPAIGPYMTGSNGLTLDKAGDLILCEHGNRQVERIGKDGKRTVVADKYEGKRLNSPNDVVVKSDGAIYFTDPPFGLEATHATSELPFAGVYRVKGGTIEAVIKDLAGPNGIAFSPDEKYLYVDNSNVKTYMRYEVKADGTVTNGKLFYDMSKAPGDGVPDGMKVDTQGNIYGTGPGGVWIMTPEGKVLGRIKLPEVPANLAWGGSDYKTLYLTARRSVYEIRLKIAGIRP